MNRGITQIDLRKAKTLLIKQKIVNVKSKVIYNRL